MTQPDTGATDSSLADQGRAADPEFVAWASEHQRDKRRHGAELAQITEHPDPHTSEDAIGQQEAWARRHGQEQRLHDSAIAQMRAPR